MTVTAVLSLSWGYAGFLAMALGTHAIVGYTLGALLFDDPWAGLVGALVADADLLFPAGWGDPFVHRGITHTAFAGGVAVAIASRRGRETAGAVGVGYASQLLIDASTPKGVPIGYPLATEPVVVPLDGHSPEATVVIWTVCLALLWLR